MSKQELRQFIKFKIDQESISNDMLLALIENAENWQDELCCLNHLFSQILERRKKNSNSQAAQECIEILYQLAENMFLDIQEFDSEFITEMLRCVRTRSLSLEEELVQIQNKIGEHLYDSTLRY